MAVKHVHDESCPTGAICTMEEGQPKRIRKRCPFHKRLCYGLRRFYYDTTRDFLDCGTFVDRGYGYYEKPRKGFRGWEHA